MTTESFWLEVIVDGDEDKDYSVPFYPQEYEDDKDEAKEWGILLD
jgi:hypothetical protein